MKLLTFSNTFPTSKNKVVRSALVSSPRKGGGVNTQLNWAVVKKSPPTASHLTNLPGTAFAAHVNSAAAALYVKGPRLEPLYPLTVPLPPAKYLL